MFCAVLVSYCTNSCFCCRSYCWRWCPWFITSSFRPWPIANAARTSLGLSLSKILAATKSYRRWLEIRIYCNLTPCQKWFNQPLNFLHLSRNPPLSPSFMVLKCSFGRYCPRRCSPAAAPPQATQLIFTIRCRCSRRSRGWVKWLQTESWPWRSYYWFGRGPYPLHCNNITHFSKFLPFIFEKVHHTCGRRSQNHCAIHASYRFSLRGCISRAVPRQCDAQCRAWPCAYALRPACGYRFFSQWQHLAACRPLVREVSVIFSRMHCDAQ